MMKELLFDCKQLSTSMSLAGSFQLTLNKQDY